MGGAIIERANSITTAELIDTLILCAELPAVAHLAKQHSEGSGNLAHKDTQALGAGNWQIRSTTKGTSHPNKGEDAPDARFLRHKHSYLGLALVGDIEQQQLFLLGKPL